MSFFTIPELGYSSSELSAAIEGSYIEAVIISDEKDKTDSVRPPIAKTCVELSALATIICTDTGLLFNGSIIDLFGCFSALA